MMTERCDVIVAGLPAWAAFALGAVSYQFNPRLTIDFGRRFGLNLAAPRFGIFGGVTYGLTNLYRRKEDKVL